MESNERNLRKKREGRVVSKSGDKTVVVLIERRVRHPLYEKEIRVSKKIHVHDEENKAGIGDVVRVMETRPLSKLKRWRLVEVVSVAAK
ncbi:30S ribosomal protein S17 [Pontiella agarivorans]|uniref:Small ribosomal subunit protein uS17 n=1 Tax=Pontiella agarivorans TaxID=3038953 RepID=A0ABU5MZL6_9BACT|nr:30S ribosomal protein S17 [Pontiella agarivorans]MDZ8119630.1 30S ribosomal protein S17 [Pontiella agarivorans]